MGIGRYKDVQGILPETMHEVERMEQLVAEILEITRLEMDGLAGHTGPVDFSSLTRKVVQELMPLAEERAMELEAEIPDGVTVTGAEPLLDCAYVGGYSLNCDVLKLGHHGSSTSTDEEVLRLTSPEVAVASCGLDNSYGHPHDEVVELCDERGILLLRTDRDGDITLHSDGAEIIRAA